MDTPATILEDALRPARRRRVRRPWPGLEPTPLHTVTLAALMDHPDAPAAMSEDWDRRVANGWTEMEMAVRAMPLRERAVPSGVPGYVIGQYMHVVAAFEEATGALAGGILRGNLHVVAAHQGRGLAPAIVRVAFETGVKAADHMVMLSPGGRATRRKAHRLAVEKALGDGLAVAPEVLADYPDLAEAARPAIPAPV